MVAAFDARAVLDDAAALATKYPEGGARLPYYRALLALDLGNVRDATLLLAEARGRAQALRISKLERNVAGARALLLVHLGRTGEAREILASTRSLASSACETAEDDVNGGYAALAEADLQPTESKISEATAAFSRVTEGSACADPYIKALAYGNMALASTLRGD